MAVLNARAEHGQSLHAAVVHAPLGYNPQPVDLQLGAALPCAPWWTKQQHLVMDTSGLPKLDRQLWSLPWHCSFANCICLYCSLYILRS